jgi:hypothetical protein
MSPGLNPFCRESAQQSKEAPAIADRDLLSIGA